MRNGWRIFFGRSLPRISPQISRMGAPVLQVRAPDHPNPRSLPLFSKISMGNSINRNFSSEPVVDPKNDHDHCLVAEIFSKSIGSDEIKAKLDSLNLTLDQEMVILVLRNLEESPEAARRFFDWVRERETRENRLLRSKSCNLMLEIVGKKGESEEFWGLVEMMKGKGFGLSKNTFVKVSEIFKNEGMEKDLKLLETMYFLNSSENIVGRMCPLVCKVLRAGDDSDEIERKLQNLGIDLSTDLVVAVLDRISSYPQKALIFFRWVEKDPSFKLDGRIYNVMARVLGREDCIEELKDVLHKMRDARFEMERETYAKLSEKFHKRRIISDAVNLFEFAMGGHGSEKPGTQDLLLLLKKIVVSKELDLSLVSKAVEIFTSTGNALKGSIFDGVLKSLRSVGRLAECDKVLKAMEEGGYVADDTVHSRVVVGLCDAGRLDQASDYVDKLEESGQDLDLKAWTSLIQKYSLAGQSDNALSCFRKLVEQKGGENVGCVFELLVNGLCQKKSAEVAYKVLKEIVAKKNVKPLHSTYKFLIERLVSQGSLKEASSILGLMKSSGFPPFIDPFIRYVSKAGTADDAMIFLKAMTVKEFPSTAVLIRVFEALLNAGRHEVAHDVLSLSPGCVRNHADVLDLFYSMKPDEAAVASAL